ncbi:MAG: hypothetical protein AAF960_16775 [Bacteroidota bacterium]
MKKLSQFSKSKLILFGFCFLIFFTTTSKVNAQNQQTFTQNGTFTVPDGVTKITIVATGGSGGDADAGRRKGGFGAVATGTDIPVIPGKKLAVVIGFAGKPAGGFPGGGGGGGASGVHDGEGATLIVAGGGGGADGSFTPLESIHAGIPGEASTHTPPGDGTGGTGRGGSAPGGDGGAGFGGGGGGADGDLGGGGTSGDGGASSGGQGGTGASSGSGGGGGGSPGGKSNGSDSGDGGASFVTPSADSRNFVLATKRGDGMVVISWCTFSNPCSSSCSAQDIVLETQTQIDNFTTTFGMCETVIGNLTIRRKEDGGDGIVNLNGLSTLKVVTGNLTIEQNGSLTSLDGLSNLTTVEGTLTINSNPLLANIDGLSSLTKVGQTIVSVSGLAKSRNNCGSLIITNNASLITLAGLAKLLSVCGNLTITNNNLLSNINSLFNNGVLKVTVGGSTTISSNAALMTPSISDPCNCSDPQNIRTGDGTITHFHDVLTLSGPVGASVVLTTGGSNFLNASLNQISNGTTLGMIPASGTFNFDFFHASGASGSIVLTVGGLTLPAFDISVCTAASCTAPIPTMGQWGLLIFGLLMINLGLFFIQRMQLI